MKKRFRYAVYCSIFAAGAWYIGSGARELDSPPKILDRKSVGVGQNEVVLLSDAYCLDHYFQSMEGPSSNHGSIQLAPQLDASDRIYVTGVRSEVVDAKNGQTVSPEFFCHSNLTFSQVGIGPIEHNERFASPMHMDWRLFTLIPGRMDIQLPKGFGIPLMADASLDHYTMTLNQNKGVGPVDVKIKTHVTWAPESADLKPVFRRSVYVYQQHEEASDSEPVAANEQHSGEACGESCNREQKGIIPSTFADLKGIHPGATCCIRNASAGGVLAQFGKENTIHWMIPPGEHAYRTDVSKQFELPFDTTAHYVTGHLHPFAKTLYLIDLETGHELFRIDSKDFDDRIGVATMTDFISESGVWIRENGRYELVAEYNNTTDHPVDGMAILYLYLAEHPNADETTEETTVASLEDSIRVENSSWQKNED